jgi:hypothetical protein
VNQSGLILQYAFAGTLNCRITQTVALQDSPKKEGFLSFGTHQAYLLDIRIMVLGYLSKRCIR